MFQRRSLIVVRASGGRMTCMAREDRASSRPPMGLPQAVS